MITAIAAGFEIIREQSRPSWPCILVPAATLATRQRVAVDLLGIVAGEQRRPARPAASGIVKLGETNASGGEPIEIRGGDSRRTTEVGVAKIVRQDGKSTFGGAA